MSLPLNRLGPIAGLVLALALPGCSRAQPAPATSPLLHVEQTIALPDTAGRIDHLAVDLEKRRLFVAEVGQGTVDAIDLAAGRRTARRAGLSGPQGLAWLPARHELVVASKDGSVRFLGPDLTELARIDLGTDADNVRIDPRNGHVVVGYGDGALAVIDPATRKVLARVALPGHPESFRLAGPLAYVNVPDAGAVVALDLDRGQVLNRWSTGWHRLNFPMALAPDGRTLTLAYRLPAGVAVLDTATGKTIAARPACGDADDLFQIDSTVLLVCGAGVVETGPVAAARGSGIATLATRKGARTGLFVPEWDRLFLALPARDGPAEIREFSLDRAALR